MVFSNQGRREERNVLDELLESHDEDEFDVELNKNDKKIRSKLTYKEYNVFKNKVTLIFKMRIR